MQLGGRPQPHRGFHDPQCVQPFLVLRSQTPCTLKLLGPRGSSLQDVVPHLLHVLSAREPIILSLKSCSCLPLTGAPEQPELHALVSLTQRHHDRSRSTSLRSVSRTTTKAPPRATQWAAPALQHLLAVSGPRGIPSGWQGCASKGGLVRHQRGRQGWGVLTGQTGPGVPSRAIQAGAPLGPAATGPWRVSHLPEPRLPPRDSQGARACPGPAPSSSPACDLSAWPLSPQLQRMKEKKGLYPDKSVYTQQIGPGFCFGALALMLRFFFEVGGLGPLGAASAASRSCLLCPSLPPHTVHPQHRGSRCLRGSEMRCTAQRGPGAGACTCRKGGAEGGREEPQPHCQRPREWC